MNPPNIFDETDISRDPSISDVFDASKHLSNALWIQERLSIAFPDASIEVADPRCDDCHLELRIISACFDSLSLVQRHQHVYQALDDMRQGRLHALSISATTPQETNKTFQ